MENSTGSWADYIKDHTSAVSTSQPENTVNTEKPRFSTTGLTSIPEFHGKSGHRFTGGLGASSDPGFHISNHIVSRQNRPRSNLFSSVNEAFVTNHLCLAPRLGVNYQPPPTIPGFLSNSGLSVGNTNMHGLINNFPLMHTIARTFAPSVPQFFWIHPISHHLSQRIHIITGCRVSSFFMHLSALRIACAFCGPFGHFSMWFDPETPLMTPH